MHKIKVILSKTKDMIYISHLDLSRLFQRALRRAQIPFFLTQGFNPHPKVSFKNALGLGKESDKEEASFYLKEKVDEKEFINKLNQELPEGVLISDAVYKT